MDTAVVQPPPSPPTPKNNSGIFIGILVFFLGILVGLMVDKTTILSNFRIPYLSATPTPTPLPAPSPTPDPTADWKTYTNTKVGFELKYPQRYSKPALPSDLATTPTIYANGSEDDAVINFSGGSSLDSYSLVVCPFTGTVGEFKGYTCSPISFTLSSGADDKLIKNIHVDGVTANWYGNASNSGFINIYFVGNNHGFILNTTANHAEEITQILSTFKFTDATSSHQVLGIRVTQCCSCPTMVDASQIGTNGWVAYEQGKDYTSQQPKVCSLPNIGACTPCPPLETKSYTCPPSGWADCMPSPNASEKCTQEEMDWYKANCPDFKGGAY